MTFGLGGVDFAVTAFFTVFFFLEVFGWLTSSVIPQRSSRVSCTPAEYCGRGSISGFSSAGCGFSANKVAILSVAVLAVLIVMAIVGPFLSPYNYRTTDVASVSDKLAEVGREALGPDREHWFGVDTLGRDLWARVWMGTRYSLMIGFVAAIVQAIIGVMVG